MRVPGRGQNGWSARSWMRRQRWFGRRSAQDLNVVRGGEGQRRAVEQLVVQRAERTFRCRAHSPVEGERPHVRGLETNRPVPSCPPLPTEGAPAIPRFGDMDWPTAGSTPDHFRGNAAIGQCRGVAVHLIRIEPNRGEHVSGDPRWEVGFDERTDGAYSTPRSDSARSTGSVRRPVIGSQSFGTSRSSVHSPSERRRVNGYAAAQVGAVVEVGPNSDSRAASSGPASVHARGAGPGLRRATSRRPRLRLDERDQELAAARGEPRAHDSTQRQPKHRCIPAHDARGAPRVQLSTESRIWRSVRCVALVGERAARSRAAIYPWR